MKNAAKAGVFGGVMLAVGAAAGYGIARLVDLISYKKTVKQMSEEELTICEGDCSECNCATECADAQVNE